MANRSLLQIHGRWIVPVVLFLGLANALAQPVVLHLKNGDRISGTIASEDTNRVVLATPWAREVVVPLAEILKRELPAVPAAPAAPAPAQAETAKPAENKPSLQTAAAPAPKPPPPPVKPKPPTHWGGDLEVGAALLFTEKDQQLYNGRFKLTYAYDRFRNAFDYLASYGKTEGVVSANRMDGSAKTDFDLGRRFYIYNLAGAGYDEIRKIDLRYEIGPGLGYHLIKLTNFVLNTETGAAYQSQHFSDSQVQETFYLRLAEYSTWSISKKLSIDEKFEFFPQVEGFDQYRFRFEANLRLLLQNNIYLNLTILDQYDTQPANTVQRNDLQLRSSIGVKF